MKIIKFQHLTFCDFRPIARGMPVKGGVGPDVKFPVALR